MLERGSTTGEVGADAEKDTTSKLTRARFVSRSVMSAAALRERVRRVECIVCMGLT